MLVETDEHQSVFRHDDLLVEAGLRDRRPDHPGGIDEIDYSIDTHVFKKPQMLTDPRPARAKDFCQMIDGVEVRRVNVATRAYKIANQAFQTRVAYSSGTTFGKPIARSDPVPARRDRDEVSRPRAR